MKILNTPLLSGGSKVNKPDMVVVHAMAEWIHINEQSAEQLGVETKDYHCLEWLSVRGLSAHRLILPDGYVCHCRHDNRIAYHARGYNTNTLGVEFIVQGLHNWESFIETIKTDWVTTKQWEAGIELIRDEWRYAIASSNRLVRHVDIDDPKRKPDPGTGFKWDKFRYEVL